MIAPVHISFRGRNNETFAIAQAFPWVPAAWPLPVGSYFDAHARKSETSIVIAFSFDSRDGTIAVSWDAGTSSVVLTFEKSAAGMRYVSPATYPFDVRLVRPTGTGPRVDVIGVGQIQILQGVTR